MSKTVPFQTTQFSISTQLSSIGRIDRILSGATTPGLSGPGNDGNEEVLCIPRSSSITGILPLDCLVSYPGHPLGGVTYPSAEVQSVYSTAPAPTGQQLPLGDVIVIGVAVPFSKIGLLSYKRLVNYSSAKLHTGS